MVAVLHQAPGTDAPDAVAAWLAGLAATYASDGVRAIAAAWNMSQEVAGEARNADGEALKERALGTASILAGLKLDPASIAAALLLPLPSIGKFDIASVAAKHGAEVASLVAGVARMSEIRALVAGNDANARSAQAENLRKMLLAMVEDIRVVLIKLAERTQALRYAIANDADRAREIAREVSDLYAPLANRLGVWQLKWELEDLSLRALEPNVYKEIARALDERRVDRQRYIEDVVATLKHELAAAHIDAEVSGRPKHITSIRNKMRRKSAGLDALYDIRGVRILVSDVKDCYAALGIVHSLWTPLPGEFDDYIAKPKSNDYRSLHTAVVGPEGKPLEVQIRTWQMHQHSEYGVASHWRYKEDAIGKKSDPGFDERISWLRQVLDWKDAIVDAGEWLTGFNESLFTDTIYVLTPLGKVVDLPRGATPVDFAYAVHTNLGHRCRGARVDGQMVPLNQRLENGQRVEVITVKQGGPSRDWLNPELGYVTSHRARSKVRQWFNAQQHDATLAQGRAIVERTLARAGASALNLDALAAQAGFAKLDDFFAAAARDEINLRAIQTAIRALAEPEPRPSIIESDLVTTRKSRASGSGGILIVGVDRLMTGLAKCCRPAPPDKIVGFVTRGKGITVHRANCANLERARRESPERLIESNWGEARGDVFPVDIVVEASDRSGLLRDVSEIFSKEKINVTAVNTLSRRDLARMSFTLEVKSIAELKRALTQVLDVPGVLSASRR
ncbi:MAG TPA: bifunctional (p)ppGpp synthetase/guanosine-3',5'-bis(diphosphate) 3'-pyrophosphohydrolase [Casimicrobiaceae bacterium]|nr:bifunctional (p)ppGpp synthetase/guanosine-3',5'-bis(diphosphate) 3'-pyrophosphohydrolase [Casimicrobiaceae bacterium]